jgi:very-short-patch-repair endonuclease
VGVVRPRRIDMRAGRPIRARARGLRSNLTNAERALWRQLRQRQLGWRFRRQFPIPPYVVDFACIEARLIVEADGGQHALSSHDKRRDAKLIAQGWRILRFWNNDILGNRAVVLQTIAEALGPNPHPNPPPQAGEGNSACCDSGITSGTARGARLYYAAAPIAPPPPLAGEGWGGG